jgi:hypothetical protein
MIIKTTVGRDNKYSLLKQAPMVLRARGYRLYTQSGKRLIDLWLNGGAAVLGHTPANMLRELKNTASRGLYAPFPHFMENRFLKALSKLLPGRYFRFYAAPPLELSAASLWRPFENKKMLDTVSIPDTLVPSTSVLVLPGIQGWNTDGLPLGLCVVSAKSESELTHLPPGDILSPILLAVATRGVHDLIAATQQVAATQRAEPQLLRTFKVLQTQTKWQRQGIYLYLKEEHEPDEYAALFHRFLDAGFLLPPVSFHPLILPGELSDGEDAKLAAVLGMGIQNT